MGNLGNVLPIELEERKIDLEIRRKIRDLKENKRFEKRIATERGRPREITDHPQRTFIRNRF